MPGRVACRDPRGYNTAMKNRLLGQWIEKQLADRPLRANSLIITIYGDMIAPHGGTAWLGGLIRLVEPLGLNPRTVRTSVFRLSREKWLVSEQIGRRSYYSLTAMGRRRFEHAFHRIYDDARVSWDGDWQVVLTVGDSLTPALRDALRKELLWEGYAAIAPGVLVHPSGKTDELLDILQIAGAHDKVVVLRAQTIGALSSRPLKELVDQCWNLGNVAAEYQSFIDHFRSVARALRNASGLDPEQCFIIRTLLMHEFRRVQLRDPSLPRQLLPDDWPGDTARAMCRDIYQLCWGKTETHLMQTLETADGPLPRAAKSFHTRFGGIVLDESEQGGSQPIGAS
jgi:phenylacetic acid degradation operon negative regulatory protein